MDWIVLTMHLKAGMVIQSYFKLMEDRSLKENLKEMYSPLLKDLELQDHTRKMSNPT